MNSVKKLAGDTVIYGMSSIVGRFINWWLMPYHAQIFLPAEYGVVTNLYGYVAFFMVILPFGLETGYFRFAGKEHDARSTYSSSLLSLIGISLVFLSLVYLFSNDIAIWIDYSNHVEYIRWLAAIVAMDAVMVIPFAQLRMLGKAKKFAVLKLINIFINIFFNVFFLSICPYLLNANPDSVIRLVYSPEIGVGYVFIANLIASVVTMLLMGKEFRMMTFHYDIQLMKKILSYSFPILIMGIAGMINMNIDKILIPKLVPAGQGPMEQVGIYGANYKIAVLMNMFIQAFRYAFEPFFFSQKKEDNTRETYALVLKYFVIFGLFIFLGMTLFIDLVKIIIAPAYHSGLKIVPLVLMANLFYGIYFSLSLWYKLTDKTWFGALFGGIGAVITLVLNFMLVPVIGYMGSAIAVFVCFLVMTVLSYFFGQKYYPVAYNLKRIGGYFLSAIILYLLSELIHFKHMFVSYSFHTILLLAFLALVVYAEKDELLRMKRGEVA